MNVKQYKIETREVLVGLFALMLVSLVFGFEADIELTLYFGTVWILGDSGASLYSLGALIGVGFLLAWYMVVVLIRNNYIDEKNESKDGEPEPGEKWKRRKT